MDSVTPQGSAGTAWSVDISCARIAAFTTLEGPPDVPGRFDTNAFFIIGAANATRSQATVGFHARRAPTDALSPSDFVVRTASDWAA